MVEFVRGNEHRMVARGNATLFPLPWQDLLKQLTDGGNAITWRECVIASRWSRTYSRCVYSKITHLMHTMTLTLTWPVLFIKQWYDVVWLLDLLRQRKEKAIEHINT